MSEVYSELRNSGAEIVGGRNSMVWGRSFGVHFLLPDDSTRATRNLVTDVGNDTVQGRLERGDGAQLGRDLEISLLIFE